MTIKETIIDLHIINIEDRLNKLREIGAPAIVIEGTEKQLESLKSGNIKVNGLARKFKVADVEVSELYQADGVTYDYKRGKLKTVILKMVTSSGEFYYDYTGNKISDSMIGINGNKTGDFKKVIK